MLAPIRSLRLAFRCRPDPAPAQIFGVGRRLLRIPDSSLEKLTLANLLIEGIAVTIFLSIAGIDLAERCGAVKAPRALNLLR
jgi:hypothetical protein